MCRRFMSTSQPNDFAADVMATLIKRNVTLRGLPPQSLEVLMNGSVKIWFAGDVAGKPERKAITIHGADMDNQYLMGNSNVIAEMCEQMIDHSNARYY